MSQGKHYCTTYPSTGLCVPYIVNLDLARFINNRFPPPIVVFGSNGTYGRCENNPLHRIWFQAGIEKVQGPFDCRVNYICLNKGLCKFNTLKYVSFTIPQNLKILDYLCMSGSLRATIHCITNVFFHTKIEFHWSCNMENAITSFYSLIEASFFLQIRLEKSQSVTTLPQWQKVQWLCCYIKRTKESETFINNYFSWS